MTDGERKLKKIWDAESRKPKATDGGLGHDELRDRWLELYPDMAWSNEDWWEYGGGIWRRVEKEVADGQIVDVLERARDEGVKVTSHLLGSVRTLAKTAVYIRREAWDADFNILVCQNGTLELDTRTLREHRPEDRATKAVPYDYDPSAKADMFLQVLHDAVSEAADYLQEFAGYCLTPDTSHETAVWLKGPRGSGKSTVIEGFQAMLGEKHDILGLGEIESSPFALARIPGKTLLTSTEQPAAYLKSTHVIDSLVSGESLMVNIKNKPKEIVKPVAKVMWAMNEAPRIATAQSGIFRRVNIVTFPKLERKADPLVKGYVKQEGAGILNWALDGLVRLVERGEFAPPESVKNANLEWEHANDLPAQFVEEMCVTGSEFEIPSGILYDNYSEWARSNGHIPTSSNRVGEDWRRLGFVRINRHGRKWWKGVKIRGSNL